MRPVASHEPPKRVGPGWAWWVATGFGSGLLRPAPGTWGSFAALVAWLGLVVLLHPLPQRLFGCLLGLAALLATLASVAASGVVVRQSGLKDPSHVVSDEWAGMWLALWPARRLVSDAINAINANNGSIGGDGWLHATAAALAAFLLFRLFDIWKPPPIRSLERLPGGWGVTMDDVAAGIFAGLAVYCLLMSVQGFRL